MATKTIKPGRINRGETIGIVSPSGPVSMDKEHAEAFEKGIKRLVELGFKVKIGQYAREKYYYSAGTPKQRAQDLHKMFLDSKVKTILISIGGETANEVLPLIDFKLIKKHPKILIGMSDATTLLVSITDKTGLITFYGPDLIYSFGKQTNTQKFDDQLFNCIMRGKAEFKPLDNLKDDEGNKIKTGWQTIRQGKAQGKLIGGYLEIVMSLVATSHLTNLNNSILYLESMEGSHTIHMRLQYLKLLGVFEKISGLILGYFPDVKKDKKYYRPIGDIVLELTKNQKFPILQVNELGHMVKNYTWPNGLRVNLDANNKQIKALENCVI